MTYKEKAIRLIIERLGVKDYNQAEEIVELLENEGSFKPNVLGELNAPNNIYDWSEEIR